MDLNGAAIATAEERIINLLSHESAELTAKQAASMGRMCERHAKSLLRRMHSEERIHIKRWVSARVAHGNPAASYVNGPGKDAPKPEGAEGRIRMMLEHKHELSAVRAAKLGLMSERTASVLLARLCEERFCHVVAWAHERYAAGEPGAVYAIGDGEDAMRPAPLEGRERKRRYDTRKKEAAAAEAATAFATARDVAARQFALDADDYAPVRRIVPAGVAQRHTDGVIKVTPPAVSRPLYDLRRRIRTRKERDGSNNHFDLMQALYAGAVAAP